MAHLSDISRTSSRPCRLILTQRSEGKQDKMLKSGVHEASRSSVGSVMTETDLQEAAGLTNNFWNFFSFVT